MRTRAATPAVLVAMLLTACGAAPPTTVEPTEAATSIPAPPTATPTPSPEETEPPTPTPSPEPASEYAIPGAHEEELPAADLSQSEITDLFLGGSGLGVSVDEFVAAWNSDADLQEELRIGDLVLEPVGPTGMAVTQHFFSDTLGVMLLTDADENLRSAMVLGERGATGDLVEDGLADLQHSFAEHYFVSAVNPRLDAFEQNNLVADMTDLDEIIADGLDGLGKFYSSPLREMIVVKGVRYDMARDSDGLLYLIATGE
jgi:hypothetical protein